MQRQVVSTWSWLPGTDFTKL